MQPTGRNLNRLVSWAPPHLYSALLASNMQLDAAGLAELLNMEHVPQVQWRLRWHIGMVTAARGWSCQVLSGPAEVPLLEEAAVNRSEGMSFGGRPISWVTLGQ